MMAHEKGLCLFEIERSTGENYVDTKILVEHSCDAILRMMLRGMKLAFAVERRHPHPFLSDFPIVH